MFCQIFLLFIEKLIVFSLHLIYSPAETKNEMIKKLTITAVLFVLFNTFSTGQVGIGTIAPKGSLEIESTNMGVVMPRVNLTATNNTSPVINPQGGNLEVGTMVHNLTDNTPGTYSVSPGLYFWNGTHWVSLFQKKFEKQHQ